MKTKLKTFLPIRPCFALGAVLAICSPLPAQPSDPVDMTLKMGVKTTVDCQTMMARKEKMAAEIKTQDAQLTEDVAKMNRTTGPEQTTIMAAVVTHMLAQRIATDAQKATMQEAMMAHMMEHMQMGATSMAGCPMMKGMGGMDEKPADGHHAHGDASKN